MVKRHSDRRRVVHHHPHLQSLNLKSDCFFFERDALCFRVGPWTDANTHLQEHRYEDRQTHRTQAGGHTRRRIQRHRDKPKRRESWRLMERQTTGQGKKEKEREKERERKGENTRIIPPADRMEEQS